MQTAHHWPQVGPYTEPSAGARAQWPAGCDHLPAAAPTPAAPAASAAALRRKLHALELTHLREHCAELAERIEALERDLRDAQASADQWQSEAEALREDVGARGGVVQLYRDGSMSIAYGRAGDPCDEARA